MNSLAFLVGNYTPRNLSAPNTTLPTKNLDTTKVSAIKFSSHRQENFSQQLQPKESRAFFKRREAIGLGFCTGFLDVLLQQQLTATAEEAPCELTVAPSGLAFCDRIVGTGPEAVKGQLIKAHYVGKLESGKIFDSSYNRGKPLTFRVGVGEDKNCSQLIALLFVKERKVNHNTGRNGRNVSYIGLPYVTVTDSGAMLLVLVSKQLTAPLIESNRSSKVGTKPCYLSWILGGKRKLKLPPELAYGMRGAGCKGAKAKLARKRKVKNKWSMRSKKEKSDKERFSATIYDKKDEAKLAALEDALAAPKLPVKPSPFASSSSSAMDATTTTTIIYTEMGSNGFV
ncbi:hypothetical protein SADUNF_Sadunf01G0055400 [Salix dunnii]|uniref:peptidylprolyl isomerase n=1 Tax=Salix dunnii TaxID=1413687 RepID=A0A835TM95_9ROSI|nr:hypothetical protein SADUNF_Sadunf01G0055400 [Salix dunnii]